MSITVPDWKQFEIAVATFVDALGTGAKVTHDVKTPDAHTGHPRQRDVWIEWLMGNLFPVKALVSCKYWNSKLDELDIDHFNGEFLAAKAQVGIIYARTGFNDRALEKARVLGFNCCRLYANEPTDIPQTLKLGLAYVFSPRFMMGVSGSYRGYNFKTWAEVLALPYSQSTVMDGLISEFDRYQALNDPAQRWQTSRQGKVVVLQVRGDGAPIDVTATIKDRAHRARAEYTLLDGSYNQTSGHFVGREMTPWLDIRGETPGPGWEEVNDLPEQRPAVGAHFYLSANWRRVLEDFANTPFPVVG